MSVLLTLYSHIWLKLFINAFFSLEHPLSLLHDYLLDIFQISVKTSSSKQCFLTLIQLRSPCFVDIWHSVLFPLDMCPNCCTTFNFEIHLISVVLLKQVLIHKVHMCALHYCPFFASNMPSLGVCSMKLFYLCRIKFQ